MQEREVMPIGFRLMSLVLVIGGLLWSVYSIFAAGVYVPPECDAFELKVVNFLSIPALVAALFYCVKGYTKNSAGYLRFFLYLTILSTFYASLYTRKEPVFFLIVDILEFGVLCILAVVRDLGRKKSFFLCGSCLYLTLISVLFNFFIGQPVSSNQFVALVLSVVLYVMIYAKYADKEIRRTK